jgi:large subunit ribosomal protein L4
MATIDVLDVTGKKTGSRELASAVFEAPVNVPLMHQVVVAGLASLRAGTHKVKTRGDVRGGGKKPWRQKGTGRARQGSIRAPQWAGGGVAHGPVLRDHDVRVNKKMRRGALRSALTDAFATGKLALVGELAFDEPKTKQAVEVLDALDVEGRVLVVLAAPTDSGAVERSFRNLPHVRIAYAGGLGTYDVLLADRVVITADAIDALEGVSATPAPTATSQDGEAS